MAKIQINNPRQIINGGAKKYYFKVKGLGGPKGDKGDKGDTGSRGPQGEPGNAATVYVGSTTTLEVGQDATVENVGTQYNAVLNFGIPQGPRGPQGIQGERGEPGQTGQTGPRGPQGERGTNATVYVGTTTTTNPGTQARVYNSGTDSNAVLNFEIPRGDVGPQPELVQTTGTSTTKAMSQNATTVALATKQNTIDSSHKLSADLVTDTSTTNKFVTAEDKTTWNAKQNALTAGQGIDITSDVISTPALVPEVVASLPAEGTESKLYLTPKAHTSQTATGNPITASVTEQAGALESFQLDGDTYQQSYTGKNLVNINFTDSTSNGVTKTLNADGSITLNGHTTSGHNFEIAPAVDFEIGQTYTISIEVLGGSFVPYNSYQNWAATFVYTREGNSSLQANITENGATASYTPTSSMVPQSVRLWFGFNSQTTSELAIFNNFTFRAQIEKGSTATAYEPYVGGVPSPSPDYPQPIQTVAGEQTVEIVGKNLLDYSAGSSTSDGITFTVNEDKSITANGTATARTTKYLGSVSIEGAGTYSESSGVGGASGVRFGVRVGDIYYNTNTSRTITLAEGERITGAYLQIDAGVTVENLVFKPMIELGSTSTTYAPYSKQTLPLNLGTIELCKLGDYQDYIWKDGENWKVHKATGYILMSGGETENWETDTSSGYTRMNIAIDDAKEYEGIRKATGYCDRFTSSTANAIGIFFANSNANRNRFYFYPQTTITTLGQWKSWLASNNTDLYYELATATDTTITDTVLIAQLEAIRTASLENGANTISNVATGSNLAGDMEISYYGYNPTNRYDKWLWLDLNNNYEQIGE